MPSVLPGAEKKDTWVANIIQGKKEQENVAHELSGALERHITCVCTHATYK